MKVLLAFLLIWFGFSSAFAQNKTTDTIHRPAAVINEGTTAPPDSTHVYSLVEKMPNFNGDINKFLANNMQYPEDAVQKGIQGTVYLSFIIEKDGSVSTVRVAHGVATSLDKEAIRVISIMPKWTPGQQNGRPVRVQYNYPIHFKLR